MKLSKDGFPENRLGRKQGLQRRPSANTLTTTRSTLLRAFRLSAVVGRLCQTPYNLRWIHRRTRKSAPEKYMLRGLASRSRVPEET